MVRAESPVIEGHSSNAVLDVDQLAANVEHLLSPVVLHRVHARLCWISALVRLSADTLMNAQCIPEDPSERGTGGTAVRTMGSGSPPRSFVLGESPLTRPDRLCCRGRDPRKGYVGLQSLTQVRWACNHELKQGRGGRESTHPSRPLPCRSFGCQNHDGSKAFLQRYFPERPASSTVNAEWVELVERHDLEAERISHSTNDNLVVTVNG